MRKRNEDFGNKIARLFPPEQHNTEDGLNMPRSITLQVTDACNLRCTYCYQHNKGHHKMSFETAKKFIDLVLECGLKDKETSPYFNTGNAPGATFDFIGGEPLLEIDLIDQICDYIIQRMIELDHPWLTRYMFSLCSNGMLYSDPKVQAFLEKHKTHLSFSISIDGNKKLHDSCRIQPDGTGSYDTAIAGVKDWMSKGYYMGSKMTIAPANVEYVSEAVKSLIADGYTEINLNCVYEEGWTPKHANILYYQLKELADYLLNNDLEDKIFLSIFDDIAFKPLGPEDNRCYCGGNGSMIACDWKGDIFPCLRYMESSLGENQPPIIIGNVDTGIMVTQEQIDIVNEMRSVTRKSQSTDECFNCPIASGCGSCAAYNYERTGKVNSRVTYICIMHKARALANVYYWNKLEHKKGGLNRFKNYVPDDWALEIIDKEELNYLRELES